MLPIIQVRRAIPMPFMNLFAGSCRFAIFVCCITLLVSTPLISAPLPPQTVTIPFTDDQGLILLHGKVGKKAGYFILDTGANGLVLNNTHFSATAFHRKQAYGLLGEAEVGLLEVDGLAIGALRLGKFSAQVIDLSGIEVRRDRIILGLLGYEVLRDFEITLNYRAQLITFAAVDAAGKVIIAPQRPPKKVDSIAFQLGNFIPVIPVTVGGKSLRMGLDTGAEYNLLSTRRARAVAANFKPSGEVFVYSSDGRAERHAAGMLSGLVLGKRYRCARMRTLFLDFTHFDNIYQTRLDGILGKEFLAPWVFVINYRKQCLFVCEMRFVAPVVGTGAATMN